MPVFGSVPPAALPLAALGSRGLCATVEKEAQSDEAKAAQTSDGPTPTVTGPGQW